MLQNKCAEMKIQAERRAGELIKEGQEKGEIEVRGGDRKSTFQAERLIGAIQPKKLADLDINYVEAHRCKTLADMPEERID